MAETAADAGRAPDLRLFFALGRMPPPVPCMRALGATFWCGGRAMRRDTIHPDPGLPRRNARRWSDYARWPRASRGRLRARPPIASAVTSQPDPGPVRRCAAGTSAPRAGSGRDGHGRLRTPRRVPSPMSPSCATPTRRPARRLTLCDVDGRRLLSWSPPSAAPPVHYRNDRALAVEAAWVIRSGGKRRQGRAPPPFGSRLACPGSP